MSSTENQKELRLAFGVSKSPKDAPSKLLRQIESDAQALAVAMLAGGHKLSSIAAAIGKSESYISLMRDGKRPIPEKLVVPLCSATGSNLIRQYRDLCAALDDTCEQREVSRLAAMLRAA